MKADIFDVESTLRKKNKKNIVDYVAANYLYANMWHLKKFAGVDQNVFINAVLENGYETSGELYAPEIMHNAPVIITHSQRRGSVITAATGIKTVSIGPYIEYVDDYYTEEERGFIKNKWGRTLLLFPCHGMPAFNVKYDLEAFVKAVSYVEKDFNTIIVSLTVSDILAGWGEKYSKYGYIVVTCGQREDKDFLRRHKSIILLSDAVFANGFSTGLVNSIYLHRPVRVFKQNIQYDANLSNYSKVDNSNEDKIWDDFSCLSQNINLNMESSKQIEWVGERFGFHDVKNKDEMKKILLSYAR